MIVRERLTETIHIRTVVRLCLLLTPLDSNLIINVDEYITCIRKISGFVGIPGRVPILPNRMPNVIRIEYMYIKIFRALSI
jgi:hypothetical protein